MVTRFGPHQADRYSAAQNLRPPRRAATTLTCCCVTWVIATSASWADAAGGDGAISGEGESGDASAAARLGVWVATLSRIQKGLSVPGASEDPTAGIGDGSGVLEDLGLELGTKGFSLAFDYVSNAIFRSGADQVGLKVNNEVVDQGIRILSGQLTAMRGLTIGAQTGRFAGPIHRPEIFLGHNERFYGRGAPDSAWTTSFYSVEAGVSGRTERGRNGLMLRYTRFDIPMGIAIDAGRAYAVLQDVGVHQVDIGGRYETSWGQDAQLYVGGILAMGVGRLDYGRWGHNTSFGLPVDLEAGVRMRLRIGRLVTITPYASYRYQGWFTVMIRPSNYSSSVSPPEGLSSMFDLRGPRIGIQVQM